MMNKTEYLIGVTGHRNIHPDALDGVRADVRSAFDDIQRLLPNTAIRLISGMADGADRIVVEEAISCGIKVDAVLPMPLAMYLDDFSKPSAAELKKLLDHPNITTEEIPLPGNDGPSVYTGAARDQLYVGLARVLSRRCSLLIALWDGIDTGLAGGTSDTALKFLKVPSQGTQKSVSFQTPPDVSKRAHSSGFAIWIPTKRQSTTALPRINRAYLTGVSGRVFMEDIVPADLRDRISEYDDYNAVFDDHHKADDLPTPYGLMGAVPERVCSDERTERTCSPRDLVTFYVCQKASSVETSF